MRFLRAWGPRNLIGSVTVGNSAWIWLVWCGCGYCLRFLVFSLSRNLRKRLVLQICYVGICITEAVGLLAWWWLSWFFSLILKIKFSGVKFFYANKGKFLGAFFFFIFSPFFPLLFFNLLAFSFLDILYTFYSFSSWDILDTQDSGSFTSS